MKKPDKLEAVTDAIVEALGDRFTPMGWKPEAQWFRENCRRAARNALEVQEKFDAGL